MDHLRPTRVPVEGPLTSAIGAERGRLGVASGASAATVHVGATRVVLGRYRLERRLGAGGSGVVWLAYDLKLEREVAIKVVRSGERGPGAARARREARAAARLSHPGIVALYELAVDADAAYLVSELVRGCSLAELFAAGAVSDGDMGRVGTALCDALEHAHQRGVIHRDVKPHNVLVVAEPAAGAGFAKLADFGVAHLTSGDPLTGGDAVVGTLDYMAPEQAEGEHATPALDVYALALLLYEGLAGANPARPERRATTRLAIGRRLPPLRGRRRDLPERLCRAVDAALEPSAGHRPPLASLRAAIEESGEGLGEAGGLREPATIESFGLASAGRRPRPRRSLALAGSPATVQAGAAGGAPATIEAAASGPLASGARGVGLSLLGRLGAGAGAAGVLLCGLALSPSAPPASPLALAGAATVLVALLPRLGWLAMALALLAWLASPFGGLSGVSLVLAATVLPTALLLPRAGRLWSVPALAPVLGAAGLGPVFVALAGLGRTLGRRAGLAAAGLLWALGFEAIGGHARVLGDPPGPAGTGSDPSMSWEASAPAPGSDAIGQLLTWGTLGTAALWALAAAALPLAVRGLRAPGRGSSLGADLAGAALWAAAVVAAHEALVELLADLGAAGDLPVTAGGVVAGAGAVPVVAAARSRCRRRREGAGPPAPTLSEPRWFRRMA